MYTYVGTLGGRGIAVACDHAKDMDVQKVFDQIDRDHGTYIYVNLCEPIY